MTIEETVREAIRESGLTLKELGEKTGVDPSVLSRFVNGKRGLTLETIDRLAPTLGIRVSVAREETP